MTTQPPSIPVKDIIGRAVGTGQLIIEPTKDGGVTLQAKQAVDDRHTNVATINLDPAAATMLYEHLRRLRMRPAPGNVDVDVDEPPTLSSLMLAIAKMPEELRSMPVRWWGDERGGLVKRVYVCAEDFVSFDGVCYPISEAKELLLADDPSLERAQLDEMIGGLKIIARKGAVVLEVD
jgi:hypothetical protein